MDTDWNPSSLRRSAATNRVHVAGLPAAPIFGTRHRWDWFLLACALSLMAVYTLVKFNGIMHGPRFWYTAAPLLMLLSARGAEHALRHRGPSAGIPLTLDGTFVVVDGFVVAAESGCDLAKARAHRARHGAQQIVHARATGPRAGAAVVA